MVCLGEHGTMLTDGDRYACGGLHCSVLATYEGETRSSGCSSGIIAADRAGNKGSRILGTTD